MSEPQVIFCYDYIGGGEGSLDKWHSDGSNLSSGEPLLTGSVAYIVNLEHDLLIYVYDESASDAESSVYPYFAIRPDDLPVTGRWILKNIQPADFGNSIVLFGASHVEACIENGPTGFWVYANYLLKQRFNIVSNEGVGGSGTLDMLSRVEDVLAHDSTYVLVSGDGISNDIVGDVLITEIQSNMTLILDKFIRAGRKIILGSVAPRGTFDTETKRSKFFDMNQWLIEYARSKNAIFVNCGKYVIDYDSVDPEMETAYTTDGVHFSAYGAYLIGKAYSEALQNIIPEIDCLPISNAATNDLCLNPMMAGTGGVPSTNASGTVADSYTVDQTTGGGVVCSKVARTDGLPGAWQRLEITAAAGSTVSKTSLYQLSDCSAEIGETVHGLVEMNMSGSWTNLKGVTVSIIAFDEAYVQLGGTHGVWWIEDVNIGDLVIPVGSGVWRTDSYLIPESTKYMMLLIAINTNDSGGGTVDVGRTQLIKE